MSYRRIFLLANCPVGELSVGELSVGKVSVYRQRERVRHALKAEAGLSGGRSDPSERLIIKNSSPSKLCTIGLKQKTFEDIYLPSMERSGGAYFYTNQLHNTDQLHAFLKEPNAMHIYNTGAASVF